MSNKTKGAAYMILSSLAFAFMQLAIAESAEISVFEQLFCRNIIAAFIMYQGIKKNNLPMFGKKENRLLLTGRSFFGYVGMIALFYASGRASQGDVAVLHKLSPFFVTLFSVIFLKEKITKVHIIALLVAFMGAYVVSNPEFNSNVFPLMMSFLSAILAGAAYTFIASLKGKEDPMVIVFYFSFFSTLCSVPLMLLDFSIPTLREAFWLVIIGVSASIGQFLITYSYTFADASEVSIYNYSGIIFSMILGYIFLAQDISSSSAIGSALVILSAFIVYFGTKEKKA